MAPLYSPTIHDRAHLLRRKLSVGYRSYCPVGQLPTNICVVDIARFERFLAMEDVKVTLAMNRDAIR